MNGQIEQLIFNIIVTTGAILSIGSLTVLAVIDIRRGIRETIRKSREGKE